MIFFRVTANINIKTTDGSLVNYYKFKAPSNLNNETAYISTQDDFRDLVSVFDRVDKDKYKAKLLNEEKMRALEDFPIELGISNRNEILKHEIIPKLNYINSSKNQYLIDEFLLEDNRIDIFKQLKNIDKDEVNIAIIGSLGRSISEIFVSCTALRILYEKLKEVYKKINLDIYINASNNSFYSRDKSIYETQNFINKVYPLSINVKKFMEYDYFIDNSSFLNTIYFKELNLVDAWLYKFGIDYKKIPSSQKYNQIDLSKIIIKEQLKTKIEQAKSKGKLLLYHPYSANLKKSIPQVFAVEILKELLSKYEDYYIISALSIDPKIKDDRYIDLSKESKYLIDFMYIVSQVDAVLSVDTSTYHISEALMIPTIALFTDENYGKKIKYYNFVKAIEVEDKSKNLSKFIFENDDLTFYRFDSWKELKVLKIIKLLETF